MVKYSLESYEKYKTAVIRPHPLLTAPSNLGMGKVNYITLSWMELEPVRGEYHLDSIESELNSTENPILILNPVLPLWAVKRPGDCFAAFVRKVGSFIGGHNRLQGVIISTFNDSEEEWDAYIDSFDKTYAFADIHNSKLISYLKKNNYDFGLLVKCSEENWIECCEAFARQNLQSIWKKSPVLIHVMDGNCGPNIVREAMRWHAVFSNVPLELGYNITLRRLAYPEEVSRGGALPMRFWFVNSGSSRVYRECKLKVRLKQGYKKYTITLNARTDSWDIGDITYNEIVHLPDVEQGKYTVSIGLFFIDGTPVNLNIVGDSEDGYYHMGSIEVDNRNRDELFNIWDTYYPEGYYPLEDPKAPGA